MAKTHKKSTYGFVLGSCSCCGVHYSRCKRRSFIGDPQSNTNRTTIINIDSDPGSGGSKIPDWDNSKAYSIDEVVAVGELNNKTIYRSLEDNNTTDPSVDPVWKYIADVSDVVEYDQNLEWSKGDLIIHSTQGLNVILKAINDNTGIEEPVGDSNWEILSVMATPEEWDINTTYDSFGGQFYTSVIHNNKYWRIFEESIGNEPKDKSWEIITEPQLQLISGDGITIIDGKINLGGLIESENVSINNSENDGIDFVGSGITISKNYPGLGVPGINIEATNVSLLKTNYFRPTVDSLSLVSQNKNDIFTLTSTSVPYGGVEERSFELRSTIGIGNVDDLDNRSVLHIDNKPNGSRIHLLYWPGEERNNVIIENNFTTGSDTLKNIKSGIKINDVQIGVNQDIENSLLIRLPGNDGISVINNQGINIEEIFKIHGDGRVSGSDAINENEFTTLRQLNNKQDSLIPGTNIKTLNGESILGSGDIVTPDTTYSAGTGISLSGTTFSQTITTNGTGSFVTGITQTSNGFQVNLGTPPNTIPNDGTLTLATETGLSGSATFSANQSTNSTFAIGIASGYVLPTTAQATSWDGKQNAITGAATTIISSNLTANRVLISNESGKVAVSATTATELGYLSGVTSSIQTQLNDKISSSLIGANNGIASLGSDGKINSNQLPALAITETFPVSSQAQMLALTAQKGDVAIRSDINKTFILREEPASTLANWEEMLMPASGVQSVAMSVPTGFTISGSPITSTGTLALSYASGYQGFTTAQSTKLAGIEEGANNYTLPNATKTILGGIRLFSDTVQSVASNAVSTTASRTYGLQVNSAGEAVVNVPWVNTTYSAGSGLTLSGTTFSLPVTISGTGSFVQSVTQNTNGITVTLGTPPNTTYTGSNGINVSGTVISPTYGTTAGTIAQGNDTRINNGQTAFGWGNHASAGYLKYVGGIPTGADLNDYTSTGVYGINSATAGSVLNKPLDLGQTATLEVLYSGTYVVQKYYVSSGSMINSVYIRTRNSDGWNAWETDYNSSTIRSNEDNDDRYLQLTGGTVTGTITAPTFSGALSGNATTATRLATARTINGTSFNGSTNIVTSSWGSGRNITIGDATKYVNGSTNISWSLSEIGALPLTGGTVTGVIKSPAPVANEDLANKAYVDSKASPFNIIDVTQQSYTDKAINVIPFNNTGMSYSEGSIDFGITRGTPHTMGAYAFKQGVETTASGVSSSAFGNQTTATGAASSAFGSGTTASGNFSSAFGNGTEASGAGSTAFGNQTIASGVTSTAFGFQTTASGEYSTAFGNQTIASGEYSTAFGLQTTASGEYSTAFGYLSTASGLGSTALGLLTTANEYASLSIGYYSTQGEAQTAPVAGSPLFKVGNGTSQSNRRNAYVLYNDGRSEQIKDMEVTEIGQGFVLKSPDGTRWRIKVSDTGELSTEVVV